MEIQTARSPPHIDLQHPIHHQNAGKRLGKRMDGIWTIFLDLSVKTIHFEPGLFANYTTPNVDFAKGHQ